MSKWIVNALIFSTDVLAILAAFFLFVPESGARFISQILLPIILLASVLALTRINAVDQWIASGLSRFRRLRISANYLLPIFISALLLAFGWPILAIRLIDKSSWMGAMIIAIPSVALILLSAYCSLRLILTFIGDWFNG